MEFLGTLLEQAANPEHEPNRQHDGHPQRHDDERNGHDDGSEQQQVAQANLPGLAAFREIQEWTVADSPVQRTLMRLAAVAGREAQERTSSILLPPRRSIGSAV